MHGLASEEAVILDTLLPEVLAFITAVEEELDNVFVVTLLKKLVKY